MLLVYSNPILLLVFILFRSYLNSLKKLAMNMLQMHNDPPNPLSVKYMHCISGLKLSCHMNKKVAKNMLYPSTLLFETPGSLIMDFFGRLYFISGRLFDTSNQINEVSR